MATQVPIGVNSGSGGVISSRLTAGSGLGVTVGTGEIALINVCPSSCGNNIHKYLMVSETFLLARQSGKITNCG